MDFDAVLQNFGQIFLQYGPVLDTGLLIFSRMLAFMMTGPVFNRRDIAFNIKLAFALFMTAIFVWIVPVENPVGFASAQVGVYLLLVFLNIVVGATLGFIADMLLKTISAAGSLMNNQIGLSSAVIFDLSSRVQVMVLDRLFALLGIVIFIQIGGVYWLVDALHRSFEIFPVFDPYVNIVGHIDLSYLVLLSGNVVTVATQMVAPVIVVTMSIDIILGIVNRTAQQMPVFQLSFALKPSIGAAVLLATLPILFQTIMNFLQDYAQIF